MEASNTPTEIQLRDLLSYALNFSIPQKPF